MNYQVVEEIQLDLPINNVVHVTSQVIPRHFVERLLLHHHLQQQTLQHRSEEQLMLYRMELRSIFHCQMEGKGLHLL